MSERPTTREIQQYCADFADTIYVIVEDHGHNMVRLSDLPEEKRRAFIGQWVQQRRLPHRILKPRPAAGSSPNV